MTNNLSVTKERPILFSAAMARATLDGIKTQTRRVMRPQPPMTAPRSIRCHVLDGGGWGFFDEDGQGYKSPYGAPGDRLWGRETFYAWGRWETRFSEQKKRDEHHFADLTIECGKAYRYAADESIIIETRNYRQPVDWIKRPAIFMPRAAARIVREIVNVRVERLQDISEADAQAEGVADRMAFFALWDSINAARGYPVASNPWVWVVEYKRGNVKEVA
jgi:hypothetical protein